MLGIHFRGLSSLQHPRRFLVLATILLTILEAIWSLLTSEFGDSLSQLGKVLVRGKGEASGMLCRCKARTDRGAKRRDMPRALEMTRTFDEDPNDTRREHAGECMPISCGCHSLMDEGRLLTARGQAVVERYYPSLTEPSNDTQDSR